MNRKHFRTFGTALALFLLLLFPCSGQAGTSPGRAGEPPVAGADPAGNPFVRTTENGRFKVLLELRGKELAVGVNRIEIAVRDQGDRPVTGAEVTVTPWMPAHGHGVWEKPVVKELAGGSYSIDNIVLIMGGEWELKVAVRKGGEEDRTAFSFAVAASAAPAPREEAAASQKSYKRTAAPYQIPHVTLLNQDGEAVQLRTLLDAGKPVIVDFVFTSCTTICPILSANFSSLRDKLGETADSVQLVSISLDPEYDRPQQMKEYLANFNAGEGWDFLTGSREDITRVLKAFNAYVDDKMNHRPLYLFRSPKGGEWVRVEGLLRGADLLHELRRIENE